MVQSNGQGQPLGFVVSVTGQVSGICVNRDLDVQSVPLEVGDAVYSWDQLQTGPDSSLVVRFEDGSRWTLGPRMQVEVDPSMLADAPAEEGLELAQGDSLDFDALAPTAAGDVTANDDGTRVIILERGNESDPYQAFQTPGIDTEGAQFVLDIADVVQPEDAILVAGLGDDDSGQRGGDLIPALFTEFGGGPTSFPKMITSGSFGPLLGGGTPLGDPVDPNP